MNSFASLTALKIFSKDSFPFHSNCAVVAAENSSSKIVSIPLLVKVG
jgi:hypothetical protein